MQSWRRTHNRRAVGGVAAAACRAKARSGRYTGVAAHCAPVRCQWGSVRVL